MADQARTMTGTAAPVLFDRTTPPHILTLVLLTGVAALNMNMVLPGLTSLAEFYGAEYAVVSLTISAYLGLTAILQLVIGPLSDRYGRRPVMVVSFAIFCVATLGSILAPTIESFLACRMLQATVATGISLSRAVVRDMVPADRAASQIGYVTMGMALMPMIGPMIGGFLVEGFGWRAVFVFMLLAGLGVLGLIWADLGETNRNPSASFGAQFRAYPELLGSSRFWGYAATAALVSGAFFSFLGGGPWVASNVLDLGPSELGFYFGFIALGYVLGNFLSGRFAGRVGINRMMLLGTATGSFGMALGLVFLALGIVHAVTFFGAILFVGIGNGLVMPSANAGLVSVRPHLAGSASGLGGALQLGAGAALSVLAGYLVGHGGGAWSLVGLMFVCASAGIFTTLLVMRAGRTHGG